jgi:hypothetical protein
VGHQNQKPIQWCDRCGKTLDGKKLKDVLACTAGTYRLTGSRWNLCKPCVKEFKAMVSEFMKHSKQPIEKVESSLSRIMGMISDIGILMDRHNSR